MIPVCVDLETTGIKDSEILQCSIVTARGDVIFNRHFRPERVSEWPDAERINHISPLDVAHCPPFRVAVEEVSHLLGGAGLILGYNHIGFDLPLLRDYGVSINPSALLVDLMRLFAPVYGQEREGGGFKWQKLATMSDYFRCFLTTDDFHDAVADCFACWHCFHAFFASFQFGANWASIFGRNFTNFPFPAVDIPLECEEGYDNQIGRRRFYQYPSMGFPAFAPSDGSISV